MSDEPVAALLRWPYVAAALGLLVGGIYVAAHTKLLGIIYGMDINNYGQNGVIVLEMTHFEPFELVPYKTTQASGEEVLNDPRVPGLIGIKRVVDLDPDIPSKYRNPASAFGRFPRYGNSLPDEVEIVWQLAELTECHRIVPVRSDETKQELEALGYKPAEHARKSDCTWHPLPDKIFRKKLDMAAVKASEAYRKTGTRNHWIAGSRYTLRLNLIFIEDQVKLEAANGATNPWR